VGIPLFQPHTPKKNVRIQITSKTIPIKNEIVMRKPVKVILAIEIVIIDSSFILLASSVGQILVFLPYFKNNDNSIKLNPLLLMCQV
jgi:hypothetical protein